MRWITIVRGTSRWTRPRRPAAAVVWQNCGSGSRLALYRAAATYPSRTTLCAPHTCGRPSSPHTRSARSINQRGRQDQAEAARQDPPAVLPDRRRRRPHPPQRQGDRDDRQVPPEGRAEPHRGQLRAGAVLAGRRRAADRAGAAPAGGHRRLAEVQGPAGRRGHAEAVSRSRRPTRPTCSQAALAAASEEPTTEATTPREEGRPPPRRPRSPRPRRPRPRRPRHPEP